MSMSREQLKQELKEDACTSQADFEYNVYLLTKDDD